MSRFEEFRSSRFGSSRFRLRGFHGAVLIGGVSVITASVSPQLGALTDGETVQSALPADALDAANYSSTEGTITDVFETVTINDTAGALADVVAFGDLVTITVTVRDAAGNTRDFDAGTQTVQGIAPTLAASDSLSGRTLTITVDGTTGVPAPDTTLTVLTLDGASVSATSGPDPWTYEVPDSADSQTVAWTVEASNVEGSDTASGSEAVAANLFSPTITSAPQITGTPAPGETVTIVSATADGSPDPVVTDTLELGSLDVTGDITGGDYQIPPDTTIGTTLALTSMASNGIAPDAQENVSVVVQEDAFTFASLYQNGEDGMVWDLGDPSTLYQDAARTNPVTATGQQIKGFEDVSGNGYFGATASGKPGWEYRETAQGSGFALQAQLGEQLDVPVALNAGEEWTFFVAHDGVFETIGTSGQFMMGSATNESGAGNATGLVGQDGSNLASFGSETVERIKVDGSVITPADRDALHDQTLGTSRMIFDLTVDSVNVWTSTRIGAFPANNNRQPPKGVFVFGMINRRLTAQEEADIETLFTNRTV